MYSLVQHEIVQLKSFAADNTTAIADWVDDMRSYETNFGCITVYVSRARLTGKDDQNEDDITTPPNELR